MKGDRMEAGTEFLYRFDPRFPVADVSEIGRRLTVSDALVPGWIAPSVGAFDLRAVIVSREYDGWSTILLPDRNIVSRMARIAREGGLGKRDHPMDIAVLLMAFAQAVEFNIEPGMAFHELAQRETNEAALDELGWFRTADYGGKALEWIGLALGQTSTISLGSATAVEPIDLAAPLRRWRCNYATTLKIAELELSPGNGADKLLTLVDWMMSDFIFAGPALLFAARYWAPNLARAGLIKQIRSPDRERALAGARNAAWDMTYLSEFVRRVVLGESKLERVILATADRLLAEMAPLLLMGPEPDDGHPSLEQALATWWPAVVSKRIAGAFLDASDRAAVRERRKEDAEDPVSRLITAGEEYLRAWRP